MKQQVDPIDVLVGRVMRELRESADMTQVELGAVLNISGAQVQKYESGHNRLSAHRLFQLALCFGVSVEAFYRYVTDKDGPASPPDAPAQAGFYQTREGRQLAEDYCALPLASQKAVQAVIKAFKNPSKS